jgi:hypothetical protein
MALNPLIRDLNMKMLQDRDKQTPPPARNIADAGTESALAGHVRKSWGNNKLAKERIDLKLLACLRARRGVYSPGEIAQMQGQGGVNIIWYDLTETKCRAASAWVREIVLPTGGERPWGLEPTPIPDLPLPFKKSIVAKSIEQAQEVMLQIAQAGGGVMPSEDFRSTVKDIGEKLRAEAEEKMKQSAKIRSVRMEKQIDDRMAHGRWQEAMDHFVEDFVTYPAAILKGPIFQRVKTLDWQDGWKPVVSDKPTQTWGTVSPFDCYPAPGASSPQQSDFIERMRFWRKELYDLKGLPGYRDDQIDMALRDYSEGHLEGWLWTEAERQRLTQETMYMWLAQPGLIDCLNYWGSVPGWKLVSWGVDGVDESDLTREYEVNVMVIGRYIIYAALNPDPMGCRPYHKACYDEIPGAFWGRSIPELCETSQKFCNVAGCAMADNISMASGPMVWVHADRLADGEQTLEIIPWKVWQLKDAGMGAGTNPGIGFFQAADNTANLMKTLEFWELKADDATGIPRYTYGNDQVQGAAGTATGLSMLLNNAAKGLRRAISNVDMNAIQPSVFKCFVNEMLYNPDESIKGDCVVIPRGAAAILIKDMAQQRRMQFLGMTANPIDMAIIGNRGRAALLRETAKAMELGDNIVPDDEKLVEQEQAQAQAMQAQQEQAIQMQREQQGMQIEADMAKEDARAQADERKQMTGIMADVIKTQLGASAKGAPPMTPQGRTMQRKAAEVTRV